MADEAEKHPMLGLAELILDDAYEEHRKLEKEFGWALPGTKEGTRVEYAMHKLKAADARRHAVRALLCQQEHELEMAKLKKLAKSKGWEVG